MLQSLERRGSGEGFVRGRWEKPSLNWTGGLTSNSSQKPCLTLSVASASLLSSRTRLSISAALMRVVFRGCGGGRGDNEPSRSVSQNKHWVRPVYLFELKNGAQGFHHGVLLVVFYQVCEGVELLPPPDVVFQVRLKKKRRKRRAPQIRLA